MEHIEVQLIHVPRDKEIRICWEIVKQQQGDTTPPDVNKAQSVCSCFDLGISVSILYPALRLPLPQELHSHLDSRPCEGLVLYLYFTDGSKLCSKKPKCCPAHCVGTVLLIQNPPCAIIRLF